MQNVRPDFRRQRPLQWRTDDGTSRSLHSALCARRWCGRYPAAQLFSTISVVASPDHGLEKRVPHPGRLRTAEGRRRTRDLLLLRSPSRPLHTTYHPTTLRPHTYIYIYTYIHICICCLLPTAHYSKKSERSTIEPPIHRAYDPRTPSATTGIRLRLPLAILQHHP